MPIYEYQCEECRHTFEKIQKISEAKLTQCPKCKQDKLKKLISATAFRLKGSGWYESDFKTDNKKNLAETTSTKPAKPKSKPTCVASNGKSCAAN